MIQYEVELQMWCVFFCMAGCSLICWHRTPQTILNMGTNIHFRNPDSYQPSRHDKKQKPSIKHASWLSWKCWMDPHGVSNTVILFDQRSHSSAFKPPPPYGFGMRPTTWATIATCCIYRVFVLQQVLCPGSAWLCWGLWWSSGMFLLNVNDLQLPPCSHQHHNTLH